MQSKSAKEMVVKNYMEDIVKRNIDEQYEQRRDICKCDLCRLDVYALAINRLPPQYVVSDRGHIFTKLKEMEDQFNADVTREVLKAIDFIKTRKRHE
jgi:competence protein ComFB